MPYLSNKLTGNEDQKARSIIRLEVLIAMVMAMEHFCTMICQGLIGLPNMVERAVDHFGRLHEPIKLTEESAWQKYYDWRNEEHYFRNGLTLRANTNY